MPALTKLRRLATWLVRLEVGIWRSLALWTLRRRPGQTPETQAFAYQRDVTPLLWAFIVVSAIELPVVHFLLPWPTVRLVALVLGVWGLLWMLGYLAAIRVFPHLVGPDGVRVRFGTTVELLVPWAAITAVRAERDRVPTNRAVQVDDDPAGAGPVAKVAVLKQTKLRLDLAVPLSVPVGDELVPVRGLKLYADDPRGFVAAARAWLVDDQPVDKERARA